MPEGRCRLCARQGERWGVLGERGVQGHMRKSVVLFLEESTERPGGIWGYIVCVIGNLGALCKEKHGQGVRAHPGVHRGAGGAQGIPREYRGVGAGVALCSVELHSLKRLLRCTQLHVGMW